MNIKPIKSEADYNRALAILDVIFGAESGSSEGDELEILALVIEDYEDKHYPIGKSYDHFEVDTL